MDGRRGAGIGFRLAALFCAAACGSDRLFEPTGGAQVVQISSVLANPTTITCPNGTPVYINIRFVNTTGDTVRLTRVSSTATIIRSSSAQFVGNSFLNFPSLEYSEIVLRPRDGEATTTVKMPAPCPSGGSGSLDATVVVNIETTRGAYSTPLALTFNY